MMRFRRMVWLAVVASPLLGCLEEETPAGDSGLTADGGPAPDGGPPPDVGAPPDEGVIAECTTTSAPITSLITTLEIPSVASQMGQNLDGMDGGCVPDYANGVDNAFADLAEAIPHLSEDDPIELQNGIDDSLACVAASATCQPLRVSIRVTPGEGCAVVELLDADGEVIEDSGVGTLDANGNFRVELPSLPLTFHYSTADGPVEIPLRMRGLIVTGRVVGPNIVDVLIGGSLQKGEFETTLRAVIPLMSDTVEFEDIEAVVAFLYDMGPNCTDLSVGLMANWTSGS